MHPQSIVHAHGALPRRRPARTRRPPRHARADLVGADVSRALGDGRAGPRPHRSRCGSSSSRPTPTRSAASRWRARAGIEGGTAPCVLNAANEAAVGAFLAGRGRLHRHRRPGRACARARPRRAARIARAAARGRRPRARRRDGRGQDGRMSFAVADLRAAVPDRHPRARPLHGREGHRDARAAVLPRLPARDRRSAPGAAPSTASARSRSAGSSRSRACCGPRRATSTTSRTSSGRRRTSTRPRPCGWPRS